MDNSIFQNLVPYFAILLPLIFSLYLLIARLSLTFVNKKFLNNGLYIVNFISFICFLYLSNIKVSISESFNFITIRKFGVDLGFLLNQGNVKFLIYSSLIYFLISLYAKYYFKKKKRFIFTKQRFYIFFPLLAFNTYLFVCSPNLIQSFVFFILQGILIFAFAYFDIFKNPVNYNIVRFKRIGILGNFALLLAILMLIKYEIFSQGYIKSSSISYNELGVLTSYISTLNPLLELKIIALCFIVAIITKLAIFPFNPYYSFFANSSNILYLSIYSCTNNVFGVFLLLKVMPVLEEVNYIKYFEIMVIAGAVAVLFLMLFEKNIKIIFGYLLSIVNSIFVILFLNHILHETLEIYFASTLLLTGILMILFMKDKTSIKRRLIAKQRGFLLERAHIVAFETIPYKTSKLFIFIDEKIIQNIFSITVNITKYFISLFILKAAKATGIEIVKRILTIFALAALFAIFIALFGRFRC